MTKGKMTVCKVCGADIAKTAKTCPHCGAKNKRKHPILAAVLVVLGIFLIIGALNTESEPKKIGEAETAPKQETQTVIAEDDYVTVTFEKAYNGKSVGVDGVFYMIIRAQNKTDSKIWAYLENAYVNDKVADPVMSGVPLYVDAGKSGSNAFIVSFSTLGIESINEIESLEFDFVIADEETLHEIDRIKGVTLNLNETTTQQQEERQTTFGVGETAELNNVGVTLLGVTESDGSAYNKPTEGNTFVLCEFEIENNSTSDIGISSMLSFDCYCDDYAASISLTALAEKGSKQQLDGTIAGGKKMNGVIGYEVPKDWKELELRFTPSFWSRKDVVFVAKH